MGFDGFVLKRRKCLIRRKLATKKWVRLVNFREHTKPVG